MRAIGQTFWIILLLSIPTAAFGQPVLTERAALQKVESLGIGNCGVVIPLGEQQFMTVETAEWKRNLAKSIGALEKAGVVRITNLPGTLGGAHFRVELKPGFDSSQVVSTGNLSCLKESRDARQIRIVKIENAKGGLTKWDGAIVYAVISRRPTEAYEKYSVEMGMGKLAGDLRYRHLFRYDIISNDWKWIVADAGPLQGDFMTHSVPDALGAD